MSKKAKINIISRLIILAILLIIIFTIKGCVGKNKNIQENNNETTSGDNHIENNLPDDNLNEQNNELSQSQIDSTEEFIRKLSTEELLQGYTIYKDEDLIKLYNLEDVSLPRGVAFIKETKESYSEVAIIRSENKEEEDKLLLKLIARNEAIKAEKSATYGSAVSDREYISMKRFRNGTCVYILSPQKLNFEDLLFEDYIDF